MSLPPYRRVWWWRWYSRRRACAAALLVLALCSAVRLPCTARVTAEFPRVPPSALAHLLADYTHRHDGGAWTIEEESNNYTSWRYTVSYECGVRCAGRAHVESHDEMTSPPRHGSTGSTGAHVVRVRDQRCRWPPLLPWPTFCEESEWVARVVGGAGGAGGVGGVGSRVQEDATAWCDVLHVMLGTCGRALQELLDRRHQRLRLAVRA